MPPDVKLCPIWDKVRAELLNAAHNQREEDRRRNERFPQPELLMDAKVGKNTGGGAANVTVFSDTVAKDEIWLLWASSVNHAADNLGINVRIISDPAFFGGKRTGHSMDLADKDPASGQINSPEIIAGKVYWMIPGYRLEYSFNGVPAGGSVFGDSWFWRFKGQLGRDLDMREMINAFGT